METFNKNSIDNKVEALSKLTFEEKVNRARKRAVKKTKYPKLPKNRIRKGIYDMTAPVRGLCLIIANSSFKFLDPLVGYGSDAHILEKVFTDLQFEVTVVNNASGEMIKKSLNTLPKTNMGNTSTQYNAFVVIILSHGNTSQVLGVNYKTNVETPEEIITETDITNILNNQNCPYLKGVPKLIFIQACQGGLNDHGVSSNSVNQIPGNEIDFNDIGSQSSDEEIAVASGPVGESLNNETDPNYKHPTVSDMMLCYSTITGYISHVLTIGSVFGVHLALALINHSHDTDLQGLLNLVNGDMQQHSIRSGVQEFSKQIPEVKLKGWTKLLYFNPGYSKPMKTNSNMLVQVDVYKESTQQDPPTMPESATKLTTQNIITFLRDQNKPSPVHQTPSINRKRRASSKATPDSLKQTKLTDWWRSSRSETLKSEPKKVANFHPNSNEDVVRNSLQANFQLQMPDSSRREVPETSSTRNKTVKFPAKTTKSLIFHDE